MGHHWCKTTTHFKRNGRKDQGIIKASVPLSVKICLRNSILQKIKRNWCVWLEDEAQKGLYVSGAVVRQNAKWPYNHSECRGEKKCSFHARKGCDRSKKQMSLQNLKRIGKQTPADHVAGTKYPEHFQKTIKEKATYYTNLMRQP